MGSSFAYIFSKRRTRKQSNFFNIFVTGFMFQGYKGHMFNTTVLCSTSEKKC